LNDAIPSSLTADTTTSSASSHRTGGDSLVHMIRAQQKRGAKKGRQSPRSFGLKSRRGVDPADRTDVESNIHRGIDP
jgi:hypothetical protein